MLAQVAVVLVLCALYVLSTKNFDYWRKRGVAYVTPYPFVGSIWQLLSLQKPIGVFLKDVYLKYPKEKFVGLYLGNQPCLLVRDPGLSRLILSKDCDHFAKNILAPHPDIEPILARSLFPLHGPEWKILRTKLSPNFNTISLGKVFTYIDLVAEQYQKKIESDGKFDAKDILASYTVDVISSSVLGSDINAIKDPDDQLRCVSRELAGEDFFTALRNNLAFSIPEVLHFLNLGLFLESSFQTMREVVWKSVKKRESGEICREDFVSHLLNVKAKGGWKLPDGTEMEMEGDHFVGQVFMFMAAGFSTTTSSLLGCVYQVAKNQAVQDKLRKEIINNFPTDQALDFHRIKEMKYLNCVVLEALRMHPGFPFVDRICTKNYKVHDSDFLIEKGTNIFVPMMGLHYDENYWANPDKFIPERHTDGEINKAYMPFGFGHKSCLGQRFAVLEIKALLVRLLRHNKLTLAPTVPAALTPNPRRFHDFPLEDIIVQVDHYKEDTASGA